MDRAAECGMTPTYQSHNPHSKSSLNECKESDASYKVNTQLHECVCTSNQGYTCSSSKAHKPGVESDTQLLLDFESTMPALHMGQGDSAIDGACNFDGLSDRKMYSTGSIPQDSHHISGAEDITLVKKAANNSNNGNYAEKIPVKVDENYKLNSPDLRECFIGNGQYAFNSDFTTFGPSTISDAGSGLELSCMQSPIMVLPIDSILDAHCELSDQINVSRSQNHKKRISLIPTYNSSSSASTPSESYKCENLSYSSQAGGRTVDIKLKSHPMEVSENSNDNLFCESLPEELTGINISNNLANTLQELAASLQKSSILSSKDKSHTKGTVNKDRVLKSTDLLSSKSMSFREFKKNDSIVQRTSSIAFDTEILELRLRLLKQTLHRIRLNAVRMHALTELSEVAEHLPQSEYFKGIRIIGDKPVHCIKFWHQLLQEQRLDSTIVSSFSECYEMKKNYDAIPTKATMKNPVLVSLNPEVVNSCAFKLMDSCKSSKHLSQNIGVLKKELRFAQSNGDPYLTESGTDEDIELYQSTSQISKANDTSAVMARITRCQKSFCKWIFERAEICRRWTWLQSVISGLEFTIRRQGALYNNLRSSKGKVRLISPTSFPNIVYHPSMSTGLHDIDDELSRSPCNVNAVLDNVNQQASTLVHRLSPVSDGVPSPLDDSQIFDNSNVMTESKPNLTATSRKSRLIDTGEGCARTKELHLGVFKTRTHVHVNRLSKLYQALKTASVPNDSSIMQNQQGWNLELHQKNDYTSLVLKASVHDHSYHTTVSSLRDIPLFFTLQAVMKSKHKWSEKPSRRKRKPVKQKKLKQNDSNSSQSSALAIHSDDLYEEALENKPKRQKLCKQILVPSRRKRHHDSMDMDVDSSVVETFWKKKKLTEQDFDINDIVIPQSLNFSRIEKLVYKEIQTPSWRIHEIGKDSEEEFEDLGDIEDTSNAVFQLRHDCYEIAEKKKYMAFMEYSASRRGSRGSRMGNIREPLISEPTSQESTCDLAASFMPINVETSLTAATSPANSGLKVRSASSENNPDLISNPENELPHESSSPEMLSSHDGDSVPVSRRVSLDHTCTASRLQCISLSKSEQYCIDGWKIRHFPLSEEDFEHLNDVGDSKSKLALGRLSSDDIAKSVADDHKRFKLSMSKVLPQEKDRIKSGARRKTDPGLSSLTSFDDLTRHSDASSTSISFSRRRKKIYSDFKLGERRKSRSMVGERSYRKPSTVAKSSHRYIHVRLSETDDTSMDSDTNSNSSENETCIFSDDPGETLDDYADPEWEASAW